MALPPSNSNTSTAFGSRRASFTPPVTPDVSTLVPVILLQRKGTTDGGDADPRQRTRKQDGTQGDTVREAALLDLVGVSVNIDGKMVCFPDPTEQFTLPAPGTQELKDLMNRPSGLYVESLFGEGLARLRADLVAGNVPMNITVEQLDKATAGNKLNTLLPSMMALKALGYVTRQEWTIGDVMFGQKTLNVQLLYKGLGDAYAASFDKLRQGYNFPNVAFKCYIDPVLSVTELATGPSYSVNVYFMWDGAELDPAFTMSGKVFGVSATSAVDASALAKRSAKAGAEGQSSAIDARMEARRRALMLQEGQKTTVPVLGKGGL